jgi:hypothetical protein
MLIDRLIDELHKYAESDDATKAIFEHFRNLMTAVAVGAAGLWLVQRPIHGLSDAMDRLAGFALALIAACLFYIAILNASLRMIKARVRGWRRWLLWGVYAVLAWTGLSTFVALH